MKNYSTYVHEADLLCSALQEEKDAKLANKKLFVMQTKISHSKLTVYQKEFLLQKLRNTSEMACA